MQLYGVRVFYPAPTEGWEPSISKYKIDEIYYTCSKYVWL